MTLSNCLYIHRPVNKASALVICVDPMSMRFDFSELSMMRLLLHGPQLPIEPLSLLWRLAIYGSQIQAHPAPLLFNSAPFKVEVVHADRFPRRSL